MKTFPSLPRRGSALITVLGFVIILLLLVASVMKYAGTERRLNNRAKLLLEARLGAEAISEYGVAQVKNILESSQTFANSTWSESNQNLFIPGGTYNPSGNSSVAMPDANAFWAGGHIITSGALAPTLRIGKILQEPVGLYYIDPTNPDNASDPLKGKKVFRYNLDILSSASASDSLSGSAVTKYWQQKFSLRAVPLFANAVYYNMDLELWPISDMTITGSVHTNGHLFVRAASSGYVRFAGAVTAVQGVWTKYADSTHPTPFLEWRTSETSTSPSYPGNGTVQILVAGTSTYKPLYITAATTGYSPNLTSNSWVESTWNLTKATWTTGATSWQGYIGYKGDPATTADDVQSIETPTSKENFANWSQQAFKGNLLTHVNGLTPVNLPGIPDYTYIYGSTYPDPGSYTAGSFTYTAGSMAYTYDTSGNDVANAAHTLIERPLGSSEPHRVPINEGIKYSRQCALYIVANTQNADATGHQPDGTAITVPAGQYRAFMNNEGTISEVILPGQKKYGNGAGTDNPHTAHKNARPIVQMKRLDYATNTESTLAWPTASSQGSPLSTLNATTQIGSARLMVDVRRSAGGDPANDGTTTYNHGVARSATNKFVPKVLRMIDIDMTELKKAVQTFALGGTGIAVGSTAITSTSTAYGQGSFYATGVATISGSEYPLIRSPAGTNGNWGNHIYNSSGVQQTTTLGDTTRIFLPPTVAGDPATMANAYTTAIWNGGVYMESIAAEDFDTAGATAATRKAITHEKHDSGVRLINGRGNVASVGAQGFTLATNDCLYILGHFNSDGAANTPATVEVLLPPSLGASTGHNYETGEVPCSVVADSVTFLSQPVLSSSGAAQTIGWNDAFSEFACGGTSSSSMSSSWQTAAPSSSNARDGIDGPDTYPYKVPYDAGGGNQATYNTSGLKLRPQFTEYSTAVLCGLVPTGKNGVAQNSGGLHNFPRFLEDWYNGTQIECRIRGSFVALFECRVGTEPWSGRFYAPPIRKFGFNLLFDEGLMPPLTPKTISPRRYGANDITKAAYNVLITGWGYSALP